MEYPPLSLSQQFSKKSAERESFYRRSLWIEQFLSYKYYNKGELMPNFVRFDSCILEIINLMHIE